jgi:putative intracellular protease/amidase
MAPLDAKAFDEPDEYHQDFLNDADLMSKVMRTIPLPSVNPNDYAAIFFSGGSGPMWDFPDNKDVKRIAAAIYQNNGVVSAVCHGTAALINITLATGDYLVKGKRIAAVTREEEVDIGQLEIIPFLLKDKFVERGATHIKAKAWSENIVLDGRLMTGQNPASAKKLSQEVIKYLNNK